MDEAKVPSLIDEVQRRPAIWDKKHEKNRSTVYIGTEWDKLAASIRVSKVQAQNKWKFLVKKFKTEHSRAVLRRSGDGLEDCYVPIWPYYKSLSFLSGSVLPNTSTGNLDSVVDVKPSPANIEIEKNDCERVVSEMDKKPSESFEDFFRKEREKYAAMEKSRIDSRQESSSAERRKYNMAFFETLLPLLEQVSEEDIIPCRLKMAMVAYKYVYKSSPLKSVAVESVREHSVASSTPITSRRKRQLTYDDEDCQIIDSYPPRSCPPRINVKKEKKYNPTLKEREIERQNREMMSVGCEGDPFPPHSTWNSNKNMYEQQVVQDPGQRQLQYIDNHERYGQGGFPTQFAGGYPHPSTTGSTEAFTRQIPPTHAFPTVGFDCVSWQMPPPYINHSTGGHLESTSRQIPPSQANNQSMSAAFGTPATMTEPPSILMSHVHPPMAGHLLPSQALNQSMGAALGTPATMTNPPSIPMSYVHPSMAGHLQPSQSMNQIMSAALGTPAKMPQPPPMTTEPDPSTAGGPGSRTEMTTKPTTELEVDGRGGNQG